MYKEEEEKYLEFTLLKIKKQIEKITGKIKLNRKEIITLNRQMWEDASHLVSSAGLMYCEMIRQSSIKNELRTKNLKSYLRMYENPYFARIDFKEEASAAEKYYIGIATLKDEKTHDIYVYDWRAPVSSIFYEYEKGPVSYRCPAGVIKGQLLLKRQFKIKDQKITALFDCDIKIDDEILQDILAKNSSDAMKNIVSSIQRDQNKAIRNDKNKILLVHGPAGCGKTSVALHRAAWLLYRYKDTLKSENIVIFSPNELFNSYISNVLPELGEENINMNTYMNFAKSVLGKEITKKYRIFDGYHSFEQILKGKKKDSIKNSHKFIRELDNFVYKIMINGYNFHDIKCRDDIIMSRDEMKSLYNKYLEDTPGSIRNMNVCLSRINIILKRRINKKVKELREIYAKEIAGTGEHVNEREIKALARIKTYKDMKDAYFWAESCIKINPIEVYRCFLDYVKNDIKAAFNTIAQLDNMQIFYEDLAPVVYIAIKLGLLGSMHKKTIAGIRHVIIDEVQDYSYLKLKTINLFYNKSTKTLLGDLNQGIYEENGITSFESVYDIFKNQNIFEIEFKRTYRSTRQITDFCSKIIGLSYESVDRKGPEPEIIECRYGELINKLKNKIEEFKSDGLKSTAVITRTGKTCKNIYDKLVKAGVNIDLLNNNGKMYKNELVIIPSYMAKGFEFDAVIVVLTSSDFYKKDEKKLFYTVCSRALHNLVLMGACSKSMESVFARNMV